MTRIHVAGHVPLEGTSCFKVATTSTESGTELEIDLLALDADFQGSHHLPTEDEKLLLVYMAPAHWIAERLEAQTITRAHVEVLIKQWEREAEFILRLTCSASRPILLSISALQEAGGEAGNLLAMHFGLKFEPRQWHGAKRPEEAVVTALLARRRRSAALFDELEALAHCTEATEDLDLITAWSDIVALRTECTDRASEIERISSLLARGQSELDQRRNSEQDLRALLEDQASTISRLELEIEAGRRDAAIASSERSTLASKLSEVSLQYTDLQYINLRLQDQLSETLDQGGEILLALWTSLQSESAAYVKAELTQASLRDCEDKLSKVAAEATECMSAHRVAVAQLEIERRTTCEAASQLSQLESLRAEDALDKERLIAERNAARLKVLTLNAEVDRLERLAEAERANYNCSERFFLWERQILRAAVDRNICVDLREQIIGSNWYESEVDGRWCGPGAESTLHLPALAEGRYRIEIEVVGSMPLMLERTEAYLNGSKLNISRKGRKHPFLLSAEVNELSSRDPWTLTLTTPDPVRPPGSEDPRYLGLRVSSVRMIRMG